MLKNKIFSILFRIKYYFQYFPKRVWRVLSFPYKHKFKFSYAHFWCLEWLFLIVDLLGIPEFLEIVHEVLNWQLRNLSQEEKNLAMIYFGNTLDYDRIRINSSDFLISKRLNIAFVTFYTIHYYQHLSRATFIHELIHIWQFERFGSLYIVRSLLAQVSNEGYDYGGIGQLLTDKINGKQLLDYNFEQMGDIIKDAYLNDRSMNKLPAALDPFPYFVSQLKKQV